MGSGGVEDDAYQDLRPLQDLLKEEKNREAQKLLEQHFTSAGKGSGNGNCSNVKFGMLSNTWRSIHQLAR
jgi:alpha-L-fucosidase 2